MLTEIEMSAAHFARGIDLDRANGTPEQILASMTDTDTPDMSKYNLGQDVLKRYTLTYSPRVAPAYMSNGAINPDASQSKPLEAQSWITVDAGFIATTPMFRFAWFCERETA
jgi:hypothetical protein